MTMNERFTLWYVDDEPINHKVFQVCFDESFDLRFAASGEEVVDRSDELIQVSAVISDYRMAGMDGVELLTFVKKTTPQVLTVLLSAFDREEEIQQAKALGLIDLCLSKPYNPELLADVLFKECIKRVQGLG
ncbi:MAG: hypothetical protein RL226_240 [Bacteroidota bacterium]|jgi:CheY-like chemotaxis protein